MYFLYQAGNLGCHSGMWLGYNGTIQPQANLHMIVFIGTKTALKVLDWDQTVQKQVQDSY